MKKISFLLTIAILSISFTVSMGVKAHAISASDLDSNDDGIVQGIEVEAYINDEKNGSTFDFSGLCIDGGFGISRQGVTLDGGNSGQINLNGSPIDISGSSVILKGFVISSNGCSDKPFVINSCSSGTMIRSNIFSGYFANSPTISGDNSIICTNKFDSTYTTGDGYSLTIQGSAINSLIRYNIFQSGNQIACVKIDNAICTFEQNEFNSVLTADGKIVGIELASGKVIGEDNNATKYIENDGKFFWYSDGRYKENTTCVDTTEAPDTTCVDTTEAPDTTCVNTTEAQDTTCINTTKAQDTTCINTTKAQDTTCINTTKAQDTTCINTTESPNTTCVNTTVNTTCSNTTNTTCVNTTIITICPNTTCQTEEIVICLPDTSEKYNSILDFFLNIFK